MAHIACLLNQACAHSVDFHPPLYMNALPITEVEVLGIHFDRKLTWNQMTDQLATCSHQRLGAIYRVKIILVKVVLLLPLNLLWDQFVNIVELFLWVPLPLICTNWILFRGWQGDCVIISPWPLVVMQALLACCASCYI